MKVNMQHHHQITSFVGRGTRLEILLGAFIYIAVIARNMFCKGRGID